jgi:crotonobetaine/carnitine-CoA ligase
MSDEQVVPLMIERHARRTPDRRFLEEVGGTSMTFAETQHEANRWATALRRAGVQAGTPVLSMLPNCTTCVCAWLGIAWLKAIEVPVHTAYYGQMLAYIINDSRASLGIVAGRYLSRLAEVADELEHLDRVIVVPEQSRTAVDLPFELIELDDFLGAAIAPSERDRPRVRDIATILYTSGTTGNSKGVLVPWRQFHQTAAGLDRLCDIGADDVFYCPHPLFHNGGKTVVSMMGLRGGKIVLREKFSTSEFWDDVERHGCTTAMLIGSMAAFLEAQEPSPRDSQTPLRNVYPVPLPGDPDAFCERFGVRLHAWFGMSECGVPIATRPWQARSGGGCGVARPGFECRLVDEDDVEVPDGKVGALIIRADEPWMMNVGYWGMPDKTVEAWRNLWLHTGDAMRKDLDGNFHFVDRWKDAIRRRGENISSTEVEAHVNEYSAVMESAVVGVDSEWGEQEVMVFVVAAPGCELDPAELVEFLAGRMPAFMVPRYVECVDELPRTATGKVRKVELRRGVGIATWDRETPLD